MAKARNVNASKPHTDTSKLGNVVNINGIAISSTIDHVSKLMRLLDRTLLIIILISRY